MTCMEVRRMVTSYIDRTLNDEEMELFLDHIEHCSDCMEELDIYYTLYKAMDTLDSGSHQEYNFQKMLEEDIHMAHRTLFRHKLSRTIRFAVVLLAEVLLIISVFTGYEMKNMHPAQSTFQRAILRLNPRYQGKHAAEDPTVPDSIHIASEELQDVNELLAERLLHEYLDKNAFLEEQTEHEEPESGTAQQK